VTNVGAGAGIGMVEPTGLAKKHRPATLLLAALCILLGVVVVLAGMTGAAGIPLSRLMAAFGFVSGDPALIERDQLILWSIRLPRIAMALIVGALLSVSGAMMQGLFRNPLADPGLVGVSSGGALAAAATIVIGDKILIPASIIPPFGLLPIAAFLGALVSTSVLYKLSTREGRTSIATFLLSGLAIGALANAAIGFLIFTADDRQLRDVTFWMLGSLSGGTWLKVGTLLPFLIIVFLAGQYIARGLDLFVLGEAEAFHSGIEVERLKRIGIVVVAAAVGAAVSVSGVVGFVGIIIPHLLRMVAGPGHRLLLPSSMLLGGALLLAADTFARTLVAPAELPIGIVTALIGAPFFLVLLLKQRGRIGL
jgi:iron complex transport system permease protein